MVIGDYRSDKTFVCYRLFVCRFYLLPVICCRYRLSVIGISIGIGVVEDSIITTMSEAIHNRTNDTSSPKGTRQGKRQKTGFVIISIFLCIC